jgi:neutral trehalase
MDNSVWWDDALNRIKQSEVENIKLFRKDIHEVKLSYKTRPEDLDYKRYLYLVNHLKNFKYEKISPQYPFQILDPVFNSILIRSNASLIKIGEQLNLDTFFIQEKMKQGLKNFSKYFWDEKDSLYYPFDLVEQKQIKKHCSGCYIPIFAGIPSKDQLSKLIERLNIKQNIFLVPSCFPSEDGFQRENYWRGPVWVNINWMIWKGLLEYEKYELAEKIKQTTIQLVEYFGICEYFDPFINPDISTGYGGADFSWTAGLIIDMLKSEEV